MSKASKDLITPGHLNKAIPAFLCPIFLRTFEPCLGSRIQRRPQGTSSPAWQSLPRFGTDGSLVASQDGTPPSIQSVSLPGACSGCGAVSQTANSAEAGFYSTQRRSVRHYLTRQRISRLQVREPEDLVVENAVAKADQRLLEELGLDGIADAAGNPFWSGYTGLGC